MGWLISGILLVLLLLVYLTTPHEPESHLVLIIVILFSFSATLTLKWHLEDFTLWIPLGATISWYLVRRDRFNRTLKANAVAFGVACFILRLMFPPIPLNALPALATDTAVIWKFDQIQSAQVLTISSDIQQHLYKYVPRGDDPQKMLLVWIIEQQGITVKDELWLDFEAPRELLSGGYTEYKETVSRVLLTTKSGRGYYGVFRRSDPTSRFYLSLLVEYLGLRAEKPDVMDPRTWGVIR